MKKSIKKALAIILSFVLLFGVLDLPIYAVDTSAPTEVKAELDLSEYTFDNIPDQLLADITLNTAGQSAETSVSTYGINNRSNISTETEPTVVGLTTDSAEDLTSLTVLNSDGSKTLHHYFDDIKFVDETGKIRFKDNGIYDSNTTRFLFEDYAFENGTNNIKTFYPEKISDGLKLKAENLEISMKPIISATEENVEKDAAITEIATQNECIQYDDAFGYDTALQYIPTGMGFKENLVFDSHPGKYEFSFEINTNGLIPAAMSGTSIDLLDPKTNKQAATLHPVDMKDSYVDEFGISAPKITLDNSIRLEATSKDSVYILTIILNQEFLDAPDTVYPVIVDPTVSVGVSNAQSATVTKLGANEVNKNFIGQGMAGNKMYTYIKTNSMANYTYINTNNITSANYRTYEYSNNAADGYIEAYDTWFTTAASEVTYEMCHDAVTSYNYSGRYQQYGLRTNMWFNIPITDLVISWLDSKTEPDYNYSENYGFILNFTNTNANSFKWFYPPGSTTNPPSITINYTEDTSMTGGLYYIKNVMSGKYLTVDSPANENSTLVNVVVNQFDGSLNQLWEVQPQGNGEYKIRTTYEFSSPQYLDHTNGNADVYLDSDMDFLKFRIVQNFDGTYRIFNKSTENGARALSMEYSALDEPVYPKNAKYELYYGTTNQRWIFEPIEYSATVKDYYDYGMLTRWNKVFTSMGGTNGIGYWQNLAKEFYKELFDLNITFESVASFKSLADECCGYIQTSYLDKKCVHTTKHKSYEEIKNDFLTEREFLPKKIYVQWTGHITYKDGKWRNDAGVWSSNGTSNNLHQGGYIMMRNLSVEQTGGSPTTTFTSDTMRAKRTYLHELAHAFGAIDSYCAGVSGEEGICENEFCVECNTTDNPYSSDCIMSNLFPSGMSDDMETWLCDKCKEDISLYLMKYYHQTH